MGIARYVIGMAALALLGGEARAALVYEYYAQPGSTTIALNNTATFELYLKETVSDGDSSWIAADGGLGAAGFTIAAKDPTNHNIAIESVKGNGTDFDIVGVSPQYYTVDNAATFTNLPKSLDIGVMGTVDPSGNVRRVYLGQVTLRADLPGSTEFIIGPHLDHENTFTLTSLMDLDVGNTNAELGAVFAPAHGTSLFVSVPEPGMVTLALGVVFGTLASRKRVPMARR